MHFTHIQLANLTIALDLKFRINQPDSTPIPGGFMAMISVEDTPLELDSAKFMNALHGTRPQDAVATIAAIQSEFLTEEFRNMDLQEFFASQA